MLAQKTTCLVTGGAGFIGSNLATELVRLGHSVRVVDNLSTGHESNLDPIRDEIDFEIGDLSDYHTAERAVADIHIVFHVAALPSVPRSLDDPQASHNANVNATLALVRACHQAGVQRIIFSGSSSVYGDTETLPKVESAEPLPQSPYAAMKLAAEQYVLAFARAGLVPGIALRYFNVFGPLQDPHSAYAAVIPAFFEAARTKTPLQIFGDGFQSRDFTYVDNVVRANLMAASRPLEKVNGCVVNVGAGEQTTLRSLVEQVGATVGYDVEVQYQPRRVGDVRHSLASLARAESVLGYRPEVSLRDGLERTWTWLSTSS